MHASLISESTLRASAPVFVPASERECIVCYASDGDGVACQDGHWTCAGCFGPYVRECCERLDKVNLLEGEAAKAERENKVKRGHDLAGRISCPKAGVDVAKDTDFFAGALSGAGVAPKEIGTGDG